MNTLLPNAFIPSLLPSGFIPSLLPSGFIPSPSSNGFHVGPFFFHAYGIMYVIAVAVAVIITRHRWRRAGGDPDLVYEVAWWAFPCGLIGGRIYFLITTPSQIPPHWWGPFAIWDGGLGIWGGVAAGVAAGLWRLSRHLDRTDVMRFMHAATPSLLVAQAIGRVGNYFNQELFGKPTTLPWALKVAPPHRPPGYMQFATFQPTFLYEIIWNLLLAGFLIWLDNRKKVRLPGLFALYVAGYSGFRIFEETLRIDYSVYILGERLNFWVALIGTVAGLSWFAWNQWLRKARTVPGDPTAAGELAVVAGEGEVAAGEGAAAASGEGETAEPRPQPKPSYSRPGAR